eukprot:gb/GEZN01005628.1/.p1 GENE.gb/GEZN01005628.1/~~gb/GEZN01005628.1/.p1  ORF type:complete len:452 (+),score=43.34 gb/GEZN01005628.1/:314-1669(+)
MEQKLQQHDFSRQNINELHEFTCAVCLELAKSAVECKEGHLFCNDCIATLKLCPTCRDPSGFGGLSSRERRRITNFMLFCRKCQLDVKVDDKEGVCISASTRPSEQFPPPPQYDLQHDLLIVDYMQGKKSVKGLKEEAGDKIRQPFTKHPAALATCGENRKLLDSLVKMPENFTILECLLFSEATKKKRPIGDVSQELIQLVAWGANVTVEIEGKLPVEVWLSRNWNLDTNKGISSRSYSPFLEAGGNSTNSEFVEPGSNAIRALVKGVRRDHPSLRRAVDKVFQDIIKPKQSGFMPFEKNAVELLCVLIECGCDCNASMSFSFDAQDSSCLIVNACTIGRSTKFSGSLLCYAVKGGFYRLIQLLIQRGAAIDEDSTAAALIQDDGLAFSLILDRKNVKLPASHQHDVFKTKNCSLVLHEKWKAGNRIFEDEYRVYKKLPYGSECLALDIL